MKLLFMTLLFGVLAQAQQTYAGHAYAQFGAGGSTCCEFGQTLNASVGGEAFVYRGLAGGAELGYLWPIQNASAGIGLFSATAAYHFKGEGPGRRIVPFVSSGYSAIFRDGYVNAVNFGGGVTWWARDHIGVRFEVRGHQAVPYVWSEPLVLFRVGVSFR